MTSLLRLQERLHRVLEAEHRVIFGRRRNAAAAAASSASPVRSMPAETGS